jgi:predicted aspartyl protease
MYCLMRGELTLPHPMGLIYAEVEVRREGGPARKLKFLVDSGAMLSLLPWSVWRALGLKPLRTMRFSLADGRTMRRRISDCRFRFRGIDAPSPVILGERRDVALLGTLTLEALGLVLHPFERTLRPMRMMLAAAS